MGKDDFYIYDGVVKPLPCTVHRHVFEGMNQGQSSKVVSGLIKKFHEIIWFYPTTDGGDEISAYVIYNYLEQVWTVGQLVRTAWLDSSINPFPYGLTVDGTLFIHEKGKNGNDMPMDTYIESAQMDIGEGDNIMFVSRIVPDMTIVSGTVDFTVKTREYPQSTKVTDTVLPVDSTTHKLDTRVRARQIAIRVASDGAGDEWYMGKSRIGVRAAGRK